jgi:hypothetical protein
MATNTYVALATQTLSSSAATITFSSIPQGYTDLVLVFQCTASSANMNFDIRVGNGTVDSGTNYSGTYLVGASGGASSSRLSNQDLMRTGQNCFIRTSGDVFQCISQFMNYSNTTTNKTVIHRLGNANQSTVESSVSLYRNTAAINIITIGSFSGATMAAGTTASLYGIAAESISPAPKATGGVIYSDSLYYYHVFGATGTFTPSQTLSGQYLVVAGGGGGGSNNTAGGGGGAGGYRSAMTGQLSGANSSPESPVSFVSGTNYTVTIGGGGTGGGSSNGGSGTASSIIGGAISVSSTGGGGGGLGNGLAGGSGGGGSGQTSNGVTGGAGTSLQGLAGGNGVQTSPNYSAGGGGGAGAIGSNGIVSYGGNGGAGITANLYGVITLGGGGGGGNTSDAGSPESIAGGLGGIGGGGNGGRGSNSFGQNGFAGNANTGGGGGGGGTHTGTAVFTGGAGGSGIVMIRYLKA